MNTLSSVIKGLGWMTLTYFWYYTNLTFYKAIAQEIEDHKYGLRHRGFKSGYNTGYNLGYKDGACMQKKESYADDDDES